ncbi:hypothetical protein MBLNU230_g2263t1 [Neophaeotheca triangularis]
MTLEETLPPEAEPESKPFDGDDDGDGEFGLPISSHAGIEQRRNQKALFDEWLMDDAAQEAAKPRSKDGTVKEAADEVMSIRSLMSRQTPDKIVKNPREYQIELFERAKQQNTIAVLDTGSGKTLIAVLLLRHTIDQELENRAAGMPPRISFFLVDSVTLVFQQFSVLEHNLDHKVARFCGAMGADLWHPQIWKQHFSENKVIVCTADVLLQCLMHSFIRIRQINLLIFDEAHHAKKNHSYARVIKDYYLDEPEKSLRPRVFGMTASPVDAKTDAVQAAHELETLLHSRIATTTGLSFQEAVKRPSEAVLRYAPLKAPFETSFLRDVKTRWPNVIIYKDLYERCESIASHLGRWCADQYLLRALSEQKLRKFVSRTERAFNSRKIARPIGELDDAVAELQEASKYVEQQSQERSFQMEESDLSSKVQELRTWLKWQFERPSNHRCIIFVERRHTAHLLNKLFNKIGTQHMRCDALIGANQADLDSDNFSFRQQVMTLIKFRKGETNVLFSTSVAEEGLDVPDCNLVVRFDMYRTMIQYVQSRGRARHQNSKFIHMIENGNPVHTALLHDVRFQEATMRRFCQALPDDRRLIGNEDSLDELLTKEKNMRVYIEKSTGAKLTYGNSLAYLANFVSAIPTPSEEEPMHPTYVVSYQGAKYIAEVILPSSAPIRSAIGRVCQKKALAKRSAAFEACIELRKAQYLDENLMPTYQKRLPALRNAMLAVDDKKNTQYTMRTKPKIWAEGRAGEQSLPTRLFVTVIDFPEGLERKHQPLALLTRDRMPDYPTFSLLLNDGRATAVSTTTFEKPIQVTEVLLKQVTEFTYRVYQDVFSKKYAKEPTHVSYWIAPAVAATDGKASAPHEVLDHTLMEEVLRLEEYKWTAETPEEDLINKFLVDKWDGARKFYSTGIDPKLTQRSPIPEGVAKSKWSGTILDYSVSLFKESRKKATWADNQPVMIAEKVLFRRNMLAPPEAKEVNQRTKAYLCPDPLLISVLPPAVAVSCFTFPAIIYRLESYMIAQEACSLVGVHCMTDVALEAVTQDSQNSGDHGTIERINFQHGMGKNYERLEFMGDCFLKTATTIAVFVQNPEDDEFAYHCSRMAMLCNKNLFENALEIKLYEYIRTMAFSRRLWYPEGLMLLEGKGVKLKEEPKLTSSEVVKHPLGQKTIADVCEALIGAAYIAHNNQEKWTPETMNEAVRVVTKLVNNPDHTFQKWSDYRAAYTLPTYQTGDVSASQRDMAEKVELEHGYKFNYPRLLRSAFVHPSQPFIWEKVPSYQRLEFLGDALLDMASISYLFYRFPDKDPQWLTEHKMAMVSNKFLGCVCVTLGFHRHLRYSSSILEHQIREYASELLEAKRTAGEDARDYWTTVSDPPKCLPDIVEAYAGAIFIDSDFDYGVVQDFFNQHIVYFFEDMSLYDAFANNHPCTHLHNLLQTTYACQQYRLLAKEIPADDPVNGKSLVVAAVMVHKTIVASSRGKSGRYARLRAAQQANEMIEGLAPFEFRAKFGCDCSGEGAVDGEVEKAAKGLAEGMSVLGLG